MFVSSIDQARRKAYEELKLRGHHFYADGKWELASITYTEALQAVFGLGGDVQALSTILSNRSAAHAQAGRWQNSLEDAEQAISMHPGNVKAYYRKGVALLQLQRAAESVAVLRLGLLLAPKSKQLAKCLEKAETCARDGFQLDRKATTDTARETRSQEMQSRGWYRGTCDTGASGGAAITGNIAITQLQDYLGILKIGADASQAAIRHAYLKRAVEEHPDKGGSAEAFAQVHAAYRALCTCAAP